MGKCLAVAFLGVLLLFSGCVNQKTATKYFNKHDEIASGYCATKFPVKVGEPKVSEEDWSDTSYTDSNNNLPYKVENMPVLNKGISINEYPCPACLTAIAHLPDNDNIYKIPTRIINHYHKITDSIPYIDSALAHNLRLQLGNTLQTNTALQNTMIANNKAANAKYDALSKSKKMWMWIAIAACGGFLGFKGIFWLIKRII